VKLDLMTLVIVVFTLGVLLTAVVPMVNEESPVVLTSFNAINHMAASR